MHSIRPDFPPEFDMKKTSPIRAPWRPLFVLVCALAADARLSAVDLFWNGANISANPAAGGTGNWNSVNTWRTGSDAGAQATWAANDNATLAATAGTLTINTSSVVASTVTIQTSGYKITSTAGSRTLSAASLVLGANVMAEFNIANSGSAWTLGGVTFGSGSQLLLSGNATASNSNRINLNVANATINGGSIALAGTGAGITGLVATAAGVTLNTNVSNDSATSNTMIGANSGASLMVGGTISGTAGVRFASDGSGGGAGTVTLNAANTYLGDSQFAGAPSGSVKLGIDNGLSTVSNLVMGFSSGSGQTFDLNGFNQTVALLTSNSGGTGKVTNSAAGPGTSTLTINGASTSGVFGLVIEDGATRKTALLRAGSGTTTLTGTNTYSGATTVTGGTLQVGVAGAGRSGSGNTEVNGTGAVLAGSGMVDGAVTSVILGTIKPGDSGGAETGTLATRNLVFTPKAPTTVVELQITGSTAGGTLASDLLTVSGDLTLNASSNILVSGTGYTPAVGDSLTIIDWSGLLTEGGFSIGANLRTGANADGNEGNLDLPDISGIGFWDIRNFSGSGALTLAVVAVVPEPSRGFLVLLGAVFLLSRRRRGGRVGSQMSR